MLPISWPFYLIKVSILMLLFAGVHYVFLAKWFKNAARFGIWIPILAFVLPWIRIKLDLLNLGGFGGFMNPMVVDVDELGATLQRAFDSQLIEDLTFGQSLMIIYQLGVVMSLVRLFHKMSTGEIRMGSHAPQMLGFQVMMALAWFHPSIYYLKNLVTDDNWNGTSQRMSSPGYLLMLFPLTFVLSLPLIIDSSDDFEITFKPFDKFHSLRDQGLFFDASMSSKYHMRWGDEQFPMQYFANSDQINGSGYIDIGVLRKIIKSPISFQVDGDDLETGSIRNLSIRFDKRNNPARDSIQKMRRNEFKDYSSIPLEKRDSLNRVFRRYLGRNWRSIDTLPYFFSDEDRLKMLTDISEGDNIVISGSLSEASTVYLSLTVTNQVFAGDQQYAHSAVQWGDIAGFYDPGSRLCIIKCTLTDFQSTFRKPILYRNHDRESQLIDRFSVVNFDNKSLLDQDFSNLEENIFYDQMQSGDYLLVRFKIGEESKVFYVDLGKKRQPRFPQSRITLTWGDYEFSRFNHLRIPNSEFAQIADLPIIITELGSDYEARHFDAIRLIPGRWDEISCSSSKDSCRLSQFAEHIDAGARLNVSGLTTENNHKFDITIDFE